MPALWFHNYCVALIITVSPQLAGLVVAHRLVRQMVRSAGPKCCVRECPLYRDWHGVLWVKDASRAHHSDRLASACATGYGQSQCNVCSLWAPVRGSVDGFRVFDLRTGATAASLAPSHGRVFELTSQGDWCVIILKSKSFFDSLK